MAHDPDDALHSIFGPAEHEQDTGHLTRHIGSCLLHDLTVEPARSSWRVAACYTTHPQLT